jgi:hypothetical protein
MFAVEVEVHGKEGAEGRNERRQEDSEGQQQGYELQADVQDQLM